MSKNLSVNVNSEIGNLEAVIIHTVGAEVENMTPENAERALYSDILNLSVAKQEYSQLSDILKMVCKVYEVKDLLAYILKNDKVKSDIIQKVCLHCTDPRTLDFLYDLEPVELAAHLIEGVQLQRDSLSRFLSNHRYAIKPLHNFFFTRDASVAIGNKVMISAMASRVRERETQVMEAIFDYYPDFSTSTFSASKSGSQCQKVSIEGGDVLIAAHNLTIIGIGSRTTPAGVDVIVEKMKEKGTPHHILVQELPTERESFIHLDMVFTLLNHNECMVYQPVIMQQNRYKTIHITIENKKVTIKEVKNLPDSLAKLGHDLKPIYCGGTSDSWIQEREQWHSGANFFAIGPGKLIGYNRNIATLSELNKNGYEIIEAKDVLEKKIQLSDFEKFVVAIDGSELSRGGGGARCMTMPVRREDLTR